MTKRNTRVRGEAITPIEGVSVDSAGSNLLLWSEDFSNSVWEGLPAPLDNNTWTTDVAVAPDGTTSADKFTLAATTSLPSQLLDKYYTGNLTFSIYLKPDPANAWLRVALVDSASLSQQVRVWVNLADGTTGTEEGTGGCVLVDAGIDDVGSGWYRVHVTGRNAGGLNAVFFSDAAADQSTSRTAGNEVTAWGAQVTVTDSLTDYVKTTNTRLI